MLKLLAVMVPIVLAAVSGVGHTASTAATAVYLLEHEADYEPSRTRLIVTPKFLRIDDGDADGDFLLYDRGKRTIYNVSIGDSLVLVVGPQTVGSAPKALVHDVERDDAKVPDVGGFKVKHFRLLTNRDVCYDLYAADGLLPDVVAALREYREMLAGEHAQQLATTPKDMQTPCDIANNIYAPARHLAHGFPIRLAETGGRDRERVRTTELMDYKTDFAADAALFTLPAYRRLTIQELRRR